MSKICLTCKYEPIWPEKEAPTSVRHGKCKWSEAHDLPKIVLPGTFKRIGLNESYVVRFGDDSIRPGLCKTWEPKL